MTISIPVSDSSSAGVGCARQTNSEKLVTEGTVDSENKTWNGNAKNTNGSRNCLGEGGEYVKLDETTSSEPASNKGTFLVQPGLRMPSFFVEAPMFPRRTAYLTSHVFLGVAIIALAKDLPFYIILGQMFQYVLSLLCWSTSSAQIVMADRTCALTNLIILVVFYLNEDISSGTILPALALTLGCKVMDYACYRPVGESQAVTSWHLLWHFNLGCNNALLMTSKHVLPLEAFFVQYAVAFALQLLMSCNGSKDAKEAILSF